MEIGLEKAVAKRRKRVKQLETGRVFESLAEAAKEVGLKHSSGIVSCCVGKREKAGGYHWEYIDLM